MKEAANLRLNKSRRRGRFLDAFSVESAYAFKGHGLSGNRLHGQLLDLIAAMAARRERYRGCDR
jgi:hypothetical protein